MRKRHEKNKKKNVMVKYFETGLKLRFEPFIK